MKLLANRLPVGRRSRCFLAGSTDPAGTIAVWSCDRLASSVEWQFPWLKFSQETALTLRPWSHQGFCPHQERNRFVANHSPDSLRWGCCPRGSV